MTARATADGTGSALLDVRDLTVSYVSGTGETRAVDGVSFVVRAGETVALAAALGRVRDGFARQRLELDMARKPCLRFCGRDHFEELLLPRRPADGGEQVGLASTPTLPRWWGGNPCRAVRHGQGLTMTVAPAG